MLRIIFVDVVGACQKTPWKPKDRMPRVIEIAGM
jgi:hypothetical protein